MTNAIRAALAAAILLWASAFVGIRAGLHSYSPEGLALLRYLVASLVMAAVYFRLPARAGIPLHDKFKLMLVGVIGIGLYNLTLNYGEVSVSSGVASFITSQSPVITTIFAVLFLGETLTPLRITGFLVSMTGVTLIAYGEIGSFAMSLGLTYVLLALLTGSCYSIMHKPFLKKYHPVEATTYVIWGGTLFLLAYFSQLQHDFVRSSLAGTLTVVYLGIFPAAIAYIAWSYVLQNLSVSHVVSYLYVMPFAAALLGWLFLGEVPAMISLLGAVIAIAGVWMVNQSYQSSVMPEIDVDDEPEPEAETA